MSITNISPAVAGLNVPLSDGSGQIAPQKQPSEPLLSGDEIVRNAFQLGSLLVELKSRVQVSLVEESHFPMRLVSIWRALFNRIAILQSKAFPTCTTAETLYEPPGDDVLPYLYPKAPDYANIGIPIGMDNSGKAMFERFKLYDVTRRAVNCLSLLYVDPFSSLIPDQTEKNQKRLIKAILEAANKGGEGGGSMDNLEDAVQLREEAELDFSAFKGETNERKQAMVLLTERIVKLLNAWDGYLRENFYAFGQLPNDETESIAYEAGRSIGLLSWGLTLDMSCIDERIQSESVAKQNAIQEAWQRAFRDSFVNRLQQQISALSAYLDSCSTEKRKKTSADATKDKVEADIDPQRPRYIIDAVKNSLEYWRLAVKLITDTEENEIQARSDGDKHWRKLQQALIEQTEIWQLLLTGKQDLRSYSVERVTQKLIQEISTEMQTRLRTDFKGSLHQAQSALKDITTEVGEAAKEGINTLFQSTKHILLPVGIAIAVMLLFVLGATIFNIGGSDTAVSAGSAGVVGLLTTIFGFFNLKKVKGNQQESIQKRQDVAHQKAVNKPVSGNASANTPTENGFLAQVKGATQQAGQFVIEAFHRAMAQIKVELTHVKYSAAVSHPLIEAFAKTYDVKSDEKFITNVIFNQRDRKEEISRVVSAAFGPLSVFIGLKEQEDEATATPPTS